MSGGSKKAPPQPTEQTVRQETIPEYLQPYVTDVARRAQALSARPYVPYRGQRLAGFAAPQVQAQRGIAALRTPTEFGGAARMMAGISPEFGAEQAEFYMSPYEKQVSDIAAREAREEAQRQQIAANLSAAKTGAYGGGRQAVLEAMRGRDVMRTVGDIYATGQQRAFEMAQSQFERDRQARLAAAQGLGALATTRQQAELQRLGAIEDVGARQQALTQAQRDIAYQDFLRQRDYPMEQLGFYSNIVRGLPAPISSTGITYAQTPSTATQLAGLASAGIGAYKAFS